MDYLFMIELNGQTADLDQLKGTIAGYSKNIPSCEIQYLEVAGLNKGLMGIVRFIEDTTDTGQVNFFENIRGLVADINHLPLDKVESKTLQPEDAPQDPSTWARASMADVLVGFAPEGTPELNNDENPYQVVSMLKGGIGGKH